MHPYLRDKATVLLTEAYENRARLASAYFNSKHYMRYSTAMRRRPVRPIYIKRRRLVKTYLTTPIVSPPRLKRARLGGSGYGGRSARTRSRAFSRRNIGEPIGTTAVKTRIRSPGGPLATRNLASEDFTLIPEGTGESQRERQTINLRGLGIEFNIVNNSNLNPTGIVFLNVAVIACKNLLVGTIPNADFFRAEDNGDGRGTDFGVNLTANEFRNLPINTDAYTVLKHKRYVLRPCQSGIDKFWKTINWYIKIKRQLVYEDTTEGSCRNKIFLVYWCDFINNPAGSASGSACTAQLKMTTYFRDTK